MIEIFEYIGRKLTAPIAVSNLIDKIENSCKQLTIFPFSCPVPGDDMLARKGYRMLVVDNFIVFYTVDEFFVKIIRVVYGRRNYKNLL